MIDYLAGHPDYIVLPYVLVVVLLLVEVGLLFKFRKMEKEITQKSFYDEVTGAMNRKKFLLEAEKIVKKNSKKVFAINIVDIRSFHMFNDSYGYEEGDKLLREITAHFEEQLDKSCEAFGRIVSDEFVVLTASDNIDSLKQRAQLSLVVFKKNLENPLYKTIKIAAGAAVITRGEHIEEAYEKANLAHKYAKKNERIEWHIYNEEMKEKAQKEQDILDVMEEALTNEEFKLFLQPQYSTENEEVCSAEALVRWKRENGSLIYPDEFLPVFERNGFILKFDYYMFEKVCKQIKQWEEDGKKIIPISVNFSRIHLGEKTFVERLCSITERYQVNRKHIDVELTETAMIEDKEISFEQVRRLREAGFYVSVDDFGAGYSSLGLIQHLEVDTIKLDKSFFNGQDDDMRTLIVVGSIINMARDLGLKTVAEGIEESHQVEYLRDMNCDVIQGYYFSRPLPAEDVTEMLN